MHEKKVINFQKWPIWSFWRLITFLPIPIPIAIPIPIPIPKNLGKFPV